MLPQFEIDCSEFLTALNSIGRAASRRAANPVIQNRILLRAYDDNITIVAANGVMEAWAQLPANVKGEGGCVVEFEPIKRMFEGLSGTVKVKVKDGRLEFKCGKAKIALAWIEQSEFPEAQTETGAELEMPFDDFNALVRQAGFCYAKGGRPILEGIHIYSRDGIGYLETADGFWLAKTQFDAQDKGFDVLPDATMLHVATSILSKPQGDMRILFGKNALQLWRHNWGASIGLIDGKFPDTSYLIGAKAGLDSPIRFTANRADFLDALRRIRVTAADGNRMIVRSGRNKITLNSEGDTSGATVELEAKTKGEYEVCLSDEYLANVLNAMTDETFDFQNKDETSGILIQSQNQSVYLILPIYRGRGA